MIRIAGKTGKDMGFLMSGNPYLFQGRRWDGAMGLYYYRNRYYSPRSGRFISQDPMGVWYDALQYGNGYGGFGNNPLKKLDAEGFECGSGWTENIVPDKANLWAQLAFGPVYFDFSEACEKHDECYAKCGKKKANCDRKFLSNMLPWCDSHYSGLLETAARWKCKYVARVYYAAVYWGGEEAYQEAQEENCCGEEDEKKDDE